MIIIQYTFCQINQIAFHRPLAVHSVCVLRKTRVSVHFKWKTNKVSQTQTVVASRAWKGEV